MFCLCSVAITMLAAGWAGPPRTPPPPIPPLIGGNFCTFRTRDVFVTKFQCQYTFQIPMLAAEWAELMLTQFVTRILYVS